MTRSLVSGLVVSIVLVSASLAQTPDQGPPPGPGGRRFGPPPDHWLTLDSLAQAVGLSADQRGKVTQPYTALNGVMKQAAERRVAFRRQNAANMGGGPMTMTPEQREAMRPKFDSLRTELEGMQAEADQWYATIRNLLRPDQQAKFDALPKPVVAMRGMGPRGQ